MTGDLVAFGAGIMVKLLSISYEEEALQRGQCLRRSFRSLAALQAGCQRNATSAETNNQREKGQICQICCQNCTFCRMISSRPLILQHTRFENGSKNKSTFDHTFLKGSV